MSELTEQGRGLKYSEYIRAFPGSIPLGLADAAQMALGEIRECCIETKFRRRRLCVLGLGVISASYDLPPRHLSKEWLTLWEFADTIRWNSRKKPVKPQSQPEEPTNA